MTNPYAVTPELEKQLTAVGFTVRSLELNSSVIYALDADFRIAYCNPAWNTFASQNGGKKLEREIVTGQPCLEAIPGCLRTFYESALNTVRRSQSPWEHDYQCSTPEKYRLFHMRVFPLSGTYLLVENSPLVERPHEDGGNRAAADYSIYINKDGFITLCAHCRRTLASDPTRRIRWEWVPSYLVSTPVLVSHGLCDTCLAYYYGVSMVTS